MSTPNHLRVKRIKNDLESLHTIQCEAIEWSALPDSIDKLYVTFNLRSVVELDSSKKPVFRTKHEVEIVFPSDYPISSPVAKMSLGYEPIYHPNFFESGLICTQNTKWSPDESLAYFIIRLAKMFQFDPVMTDPNNAANKIAAKWYKSMANTGLFPIDTTLLPLLIDNNVDDFQIHKVM